MMNNEETWFRIVNGDFNVAKDLKELTTTELSTLEAVLRDERELRDTEAKIRYHNLLLKQIFG